MEKKQMQMENKIVMIENHHSGDIGNGTMEATQRSQSGKWKDTGWMAGWAWQCEAM